MLWPFAIFSWQYVLSVFVGENFPVSIRIKNNETSPTLKLTLALIVTPAIGLYVPACMDYSYLLPTAMVGTSKSDTENLSTRTINLPEIQVLYLKDTE